MFAKKRYYSEALTCNIHYLRKKFYFNVCIICYLNFKLQFNVFVMCYLNFACRRSSRLSIYKIYTAVNNMCYVFVIYFLQPTNCNLTAILFSLAKHATKVLSKLVAASISVICSCTIYFQSRSKCLLQTTQYRESAVYVLPAATDTTFKDAGAVKSHHCLITRIW